MTANYQRWQLSTELNGEKGKFKYSQVVFTHAGKRFRTMP